jgi:DNA-binding transcriptional MerR regulator
VSEPGLTIDELAAASKIPSRTIRFYQTRGLLPRPELRGRVAFYGEPHLERLKLVAELQDRGLQIKAISELVERVEKGELAVQEWLGLERALMAPWVSDAPQLMELRELTALTGALQPGRLAELTRLKLLERTGEKYLVASPALLKLALEVESAGVSLEVVDEALQLLRKRLGRTAEELAELIFKRGKRGKRSGGAGLGGVLGQARPAALEAVRLIFAQEMEGELRKWLESGRLSKL